MPELRLFHGFNDATNYTGAQYAALNFGDWHSKAGFASTVWTKNNDEAWVAAILSNGYDGKLGLYITIRDVHCADNTDLNSPGGSAVSGSATSNNIALGEADIAWKIATNNLTVADGGAYVDSDTWILRDSGGDAIPKGDDANKYYLDIGNADCREWWCQRFYNYLTTTDATLGAKPIEVIDYIWLDNGHSENNGNVTGAVSVVTEIATPSYTSATWDAANRGFYQYIRANLIDVLASEYSKQLDLHINLQGDFYDNWKTHADTPRSDDATLKVFDGIFQEFSFVQSNNTHYSVANWWETIEKARYISGNGQDIILVAHGRSDLKKAETSTTFTWHNHFGFCLASYLLCFSNTSYFRYTGNGYATADIEDEYTIIADILGYPTSDVTESSGVYTRTFENGTVSVTPGNNTEDVSTTATNSFLIDIPGVYWENANGSAISAADANGGQTWQEHTSGVVPTEFTGTVDTYAAYSPTLMESIPRFLVPNVHGSYIRVGNTANVYNAAWAVTSVTAGTYLLLVLANHSGASGASGQRVYDFLLDGNVVINDFDPVVVAGANQTEAWVYGTGTVDTTANITWNKVGSFSTGEFSGMGLFGPLETQPNPVVNQMNDQATQVGDDVYLQIQASNPSGIGTLTYSSSTLPSGLSIASSTGLITGTLHAKAWTDMAVAVTITVSNGTDSTDMSFTWWVITGNEIESIDCGGAGGTYSVGQLSYVYATDTVASPYSGLTANGRNASNTGTVLTYLTGATNGVPPWQKYQALLQYYSFDSADPEQIYTIPVGTTSDVMLVFSFMEDGTSSRVFDVLVQGATAISALDTYAVAGQYGAFTRRVVATPDGSQNVVVTFNNTNTSRISAIQVFAIDDGSPTISSGTTYSINTGANANIALAATDPQGDTNFTWSLQSGTLPTGTSLNTSTGAITGTVSASAGSNFTPTIRVTDSDSQYDEIALDIDITAAATAPIDRIPAMIVGRGRRRRWHN